MQRLSSEWMLTCQPLCVALSKQTQSQVTRFRSHHRIWQASSLYAEDGPIPQTLANSPWGVWPRVGH